MPHKDAQKAWEEYREKELARLRPILLKLGYTLEEEQPHMKGERFLMQAVTTKSGRKLILLGRARDGKRVVIKASSEEAGMRELEHERKCRRVLREINFAYNVFFSPDELLFTRDGGFIIAAQTFIEQGCSFLERPLRDQFDLALKAFKAQEGAHATTYKHIRLVRESFGLMEARDYLAALERFSTNISSRHTNPRLQELLQKSLTLLKDHEKIIEQYEGFLTHVDFVPHNFRVKGGDIYLLDHSSLRFGNKYEGWARFLNFMALYNPELERALIKYVADNRTSEESVSLKLMRAYRLGEIMWYYSRSLAHTSGNLHTLNAERVEFWTNVLEALLNGETVSPLIIEEYKKIRDSLRSDEEKRRQIGLH